MIVVAFGTTTIGNYSLSLHDARPICAQRSERFTENETDASEWCRRYELSDFAQGGSS